MDGWKTMQFPLLGRLRRLFSNGEQKWRSFGLLGGGKGLGKSEKMPDLVGGQ